MCMKDRIVMRGTRKVLGKLTELTVNVNKCIDCMIELPLQLIVFTNIC